MSAAVIGPFHAGEVPPPVVLNFKDATGAAIDFSQNGPWTAKFSYRSYGGSWTTKAATIPAGVSGAVQYTWVAADLVTPGDFEGEMWVGSNGPARYDSVRLAWQVLPATVPTPPV